MSLHNIRPTRAAGRAHLPSPINCLRFLAASLGASILLFVGPFVMIWGVAASLESATPDAPLFILVKILSFIILLSSGYFLIGAYGQLVIHSLMLRVLAAILLSIPVMFAGVPFHSHRLEMLYLLAVVLLSILLLSAFVWPVWLKRTGQPQSSKTRGTQRNPIAAHSL